MRGPHPACVFISSNKDTDTQEDSPARTQGGGAGRPPRREAQEPAPPHPGLRPQPPGLRENLGGLLKPQPEVLCHSHQSKLTQGSEEWGHLFSPLLPPLPRPPFPCSHSPLIGLHTGAPLQGLGTGYSCRRLLSAPNIHLAPGFASVKSLPKGALL